MKKIIWAACAVALFMGLVVLPGMASADVSWSSFVGEVTMAAIGQRDKDAAPVTISPANFDGDSVIEAPMWGDSALNPGKYISTLTIEGLTFSGGMVIRGGGDIVLSDVTIMSDKWYGIYIDDSSVTSDLYLTIEEGCTIGTADSPVRFAGIHYSNAASSYRTGENGFSSISLLNYADIYSRSYSISLVAFSDEDMEVLIENHGDIYSEHSLGIDVTAHSRQRVAVVKIDNMGNIHTPKSTGIRVNADAYEQRAEAVVRNYATIESAGEAGIYMEVAAAEHQAVGGLLNSGAVTNDGKYGIAVLASGLTGHSVVSNDGEVSGADAGALVGTMCDTSPQSYVLNGGTISGGKMGLWAVGGNNLSLETEGSGLYHGTNKADGVEALLYIDFAQSSSTTREKMEADLRGIAQKSGLLALQDGALLLQAVSGGIEIFSFEMPMQAQQ